MIMAMMPIVTGVAFAYEDDYVLSDLEFIPAAGDTNPAKANLANYKVYVILYDGTYDNFTSAIESQGENGISSMTSYEFNNADANNLYRIDWGKYFFSQIACSKKSFSESDINGKTPVAVVFYGTEGVATEYCTFEVDSGDMTDGYLAFDMDASGWQSIDKSKIIVAGHEIANVKASETDADNYWAYNADTKTLTLYPSIKDLCSNSSPTNYNGNVFIRIYMDELTIKLEGEIDLDIPTENDPSGLYFEGEQLTIDGNALNIKSEGYCFCGDGCISITSGTNVNVESKKSNGIMVDEGGSLTIDEGAKLVATTTNTANLPAIDAVEATLTNYGEITAYSEGQYGILAYELTNYGDITATSLYSAAISTDILNQEKGTIYAKGWVEGINIMEAATFTKGKVYATATCNDGGAVAIAGEGTLNVPVDSECEIYAFASGTMTKICGICIQNINIAGGKIVSKISGSATSMAPISIGLGEPPVFDFSTDTEIDDMPAYCHISTDSNLTLIVSENTNGSNLTEIPNNVASQTSFAENITQYKYVLLSYLEEEKEQSNWSLLAKAMKGEDPVDASIKATVTDAEEADLFTVEDVDATRTIVLLADITAEEDDSALVVTSAKKIVLDLNGHVINRGLIAADGTATNVNYGSVINVNVGNLTIADRDTTKTHKFKELESGLWVLDETSGTKTVNGGAITGGTGCKIGQVTGYNCGGGVCILSGGNFTLNGGNIVGNAVSRDGGGVYVHGSSMFSMSGGSIIGNVALQYGGGVYFSAGNMGMTGGSITSNTAAKYGGGISSGNQGNQITMTGGSIINNRCGTESEDGTQGGGIDAYCKLILGGDAVVKNNILYTSSEPIPSDVQADGGTVSISSEFAPKAGMEIGLLDFIEIASGSANSGDEKYFFPNDDKFDVIFATNHLELAEKYTIIIASATNGKVKAQVNSIDVNSILAGTIVKLVSIPNTGYELDTLTVRDADGNPVTVTDNKFTMPGKNVTVTATFKEKTKLTPSYSGGSLDYEQYKAILEQAQKQQEELNAKKAEEENLAKHEKLVEEAKAALADTEFRATSTKQTKLNGKKAIKLKWEVVGGTYNLSDFEGFDVFRSTKKNSGYGKTPFFTTKNWTYVNNKDLKKGKTYYYKVRAWKMVDGEKVYTNWSTKAWRTVK